MAGIDNFSEINENFDTIKTLLNSIRAQGILNTSDVDKLLSGINNKLDRLNNEEDIDTIKIFLSELRQNLDERHGVLLSKFGAIESLFSNLVKTTNEMPKSAEIKEIFDIVATNLSVFSREVVSQKDNLNDISSKLEALSSDDSLKQDVVKNIAQLKPDLEKITNGFDSIVLSLNDNFNNVIKSVTLIDPSDSIDKFSDILSGMEMSSNTILSALQVLDKKTGLVEDALKNLATKEDANLTNTKIEDLTEQSKNLYVSVAGLNEHYLKIDSIADKIDASVSIIANLRSVLEGLEGQNTADMLNKLDNLDKSIQNINSSESFQEFKGELESLIKNISDSTELNLKNFSNELLQKLTELEGNNLASIADKIAEGTLSLGEKLESAKDSISELYNNSFNSISESIADIRNSLAQMDEGGMSANGAIFSGISDRLSAFENNLQTIINNRESLTSGEISEQLAKDIENIKNLSNILDYKVDSSIVEVGNIKNEFSGLKAAVESLLALDFMSTVKDFRVDLYASKQELINALESANTAMGEKVANDIIASRQELIQAIENTTLNGEFSENSINEIQLSLNELINALKTSNLDKLSGEISEKLQTAGDDFISNLQLANHEITSGITTEIQSAKQELASLTQLSHSEIKDSLKEEIQSSKQEVINALESANLGNIADNISSELQASGKELRDIIESANLSNFSEELKNTKDELKSALESADISSIANDIKGEVKLSAEDIKNTLLSTDYNNVADSIKGELRLSADEIKNAIDNINPDSVAGRLKDELRISTDEIKNAIDNINPDSVADRLKDELRISTDEIKNAIDNINSDSVADRLKDELKISTDEIKNALNNLGGSNISEDIKNELYNTKNEIKDAVYSTNAGNLANEIKDELRNTKDELKNAIESTGIHEVSENLTNELQMSRNEISAISGTISNIENISGNIGNDINSAKQDINNTVENYSNKISEKLAGDIWNSKEELKAILESVTLNTSDNGNNSSEYIISLSGKYDTLMSKIDNFISEYYSKEDTTLEEIKSKFYGLEALMSGVIENLNKLAAPEKTDISSDIERIEGSIDNKLLNYAEDLKNNFSDFRNRIESVLSENNSSAISDIDTVKRAISENSEDIRNEIKYSYSKLLEIHDSYNELKELLSLNTFGSSEKLDGMIASATGIKADFDKGFATLQQTLTDKLSELKKDFSTENATGLGDLIFSIENLYSRNSQEVLEIAEELKERIGNFINEDSTNRTSTLAKILDNFVALKDFINSTNNKSLQELSAKVNEISEGFEAIKAVVNKVDENVDGDLTRQLSIIESNFESLVSQMAILSEKSNQSLAESLNQEFSSVSDGLKSAFTERLNSYNGVIEEAFNKIQTNAAEQTNVLQNALTNINSAIKALWSEQSEENLKNINSITEVLKSFIDENRKLTASDYTALQSSLSEYNLTANINNQSLAADLKNVTKALGDSMSKTDALISSAAQQLELSKAADGNILTLTELCTANKNLLETFDHALSEKIDGLKSLTAEVAAGELQTIDAYINNISEQITSQKQSIQEFKDFASEFFKNELNIISKNIEKETDAVLSEMMEQFDLLKKSQADDVVNITSRIEDTINGYVYNNIAELKSYLESKTDNSEIFSQIEVLKSDISSAVSSVISDLGKLLDSGVFTATMSDFRLANEVLITSSVTKINEKIEQFINDNLQTITEQIVNNSKEIKDAVNDTDVKVTTAVTSSMDKTRQAINEIVTNNRMIIEENIAVSDKNMVNTIVDSYAEMKVDIDDLLQTTGKKIDDKLTALDLKLANNVNTSLEDAKIEINEKILNTKSELDERVSLSEKNIINSFVDTYAESKVELDEAIRQTKNSIEEKLALFDQKFVETLVSKYEEIKSISNKCNTSFINIQSSVMDIISGFDDVKEEINNRIDKLSESLKLANDSTNKEIRALTDCFENLRSQISNKSFDEAFQASINKQIGNLEGLVHEQLGYIEDIGKLCGENLPEVKELNSFVKGAVIDSINSFGQQLSEQDVKGTIEKELKDFKSDIITQFLNIFNQISFVTEQEEILDFVQEKHTDLITVLSHIVSTTDEIGNIKSNVANVDNKINVLKNDLNIINRKISAIISSEGNVDYIYSLTDLESDIAKLRISLNEIKESDHGKEIKDLIASTNSIFNLLESVKAELPAKNDFDGIAEDIVSISTRTNKLLLATDESYKTLQDNLHEFKLVINDIDERTRSFARESGMDRVESKLNSINSLMVNDSKMNQAFNQVFEYLAEWVDKAGVQINTITDRTENLNDLTQIKNMLEELKAENSDNNESLELIEALGEIFDRQAKRFSAMETKLDKIIVETTIKNSKSDLAPFEETLNKFLVVMDDKFSSQQNKINSLETKLEDVMSYLEDNDDTALLTKKVGGMDRQIAKLNKSIEKIASHVVEK